MKFEDTVGREFKFYGVHDTSFKIGRYIFEAVEDENDGYRSMLDCVEQRKDENLVFLGRSFACVIVEVDVHGSFEGYALRDVDTDHRWLTFGTDHADDYYPVFVFNYQTPRYKEVYDQERKVTKQLPSDWFYDYDLKPLVRQARQMLSDGYLDEAEAMIKKLKKVIDKRKNRQ